MKNRNLRLLIYSILFTCSINAQNIGINATGATPNSSSILDLNTGNTFTSPNGKGFLPPRLSLTGITDLVTVTSPATSLLVYNTATAGSGSLAVTPGYYYFDGTKWVAFTGNGSNDWALLGNAGTNANTNFVGTTDDVDLVFRRNGLRSGLLNTSRNSTSFGVRALNPLATGNWNIAIGNNSMQNLTSGNMNVGVGYNNLSIVTTGFANTAIGQNALLNNNGDFNTGVGEQVMFANTTGSYNSIFGSRAFISNTSGSNNSAFGWGSLHDNTTASGNTAMGYYSLYANITGTANVGVGSFASQNNLVGSDNSGIGYLSLFNNTASNNSAMGSLALRDNTSGTSNTAVGSRSMRFNSTGSDNTALGVSTGSTNITGHRHTLVGAYADVTANNLVNATAIGYNAKVGQNNSLILGATGADQVKVGIGTTTPTEMFTIENGDMQMGESLAVPGVGRRMFFSDIANNSFDPIFFQRENLASDVSSLNLNIGDNYRAPAAAAPDRFNVGAGYTAGVFNSILTVETKNARVGVNTIDPQNDLHVFGTIESSSRTFTLPTINHHYAQLTADGALKLRRNPAAPTFTSSNGYIDFVNDAGTGYDFRLSYERSIGPAGSMAFADNINTHMTIAQGTGRVGIKAFSPGGIFELGFDQGRKPSTSAWTIVSDERLKTINGNYTKGLKEILQLNTITYYYKNVGERQFQPEVLKNQNIGFSAQEVQKIFPEAVGVDDDGYLNLNIHAILVAYTNAFKEQQEQIELLKKQNEDMSKKYDEILKLLNK